MRVLVCGGRSYSNSTKVHFWCEWLPSKNLYIIIGGAKGADYLAELWAIDNWIPHIVYHANWDVHGKSAGFLRNKRMLEEGKPDLVLAFPGGAGTENMKQLAKAARVPVLEIYD
jgi:YspA, cpYpsA-related SLOG family